MLSQVSFTVDESTKKRALEKAKQDGVTLKAVLIYAMKGFVDGRISLDLRVSGVEQDVEEWQFTDRQINEQATKLAALLG